ncbi:MAG TPA: hypothetical protein VFE65_13810 [Pseudonocardia sp.]|jgi:hypothetical protein|nr:hypothetical protein [Pseudonocardia sp.]
MDTSLIVGIIVAVIVVAVIAAVAYKALAKRRSDQLRDQFGPEYHRTVEKADDPKQAEAELQERQKRHKKFELRVLKPEQRRDYEQRWSEVKGEFVDDPSRAIRDSDALVVDIMSARGYPVEEFDQRTADLSVDYPETTQHYREAREITRANERGDANTEQLRRAVGSFQQLIEALLKDSDRHADDGEGAGTHRDDHATGDHRDTPSRDRVGSDASGEHAGEGEANHRVSGTTSGDSATKEAQR